MESVRSVERDQAAIHSGEQHFGEFGCGRGDFLLAAHGLAGCRRPAQLECPANSPQHHVSLLPFS